MRILTGVTAAALTIGTLVMTAPASQAASYSYGVKNVTTYNNQTDYSRILASCSNPGGTCTITSLKSYATTAEVSLGASVSVVEAKLSLSATATNTRSTSCTSAVLGYNDTYKAFAVGIGKNYNVTRSDGKTSSLLWAFQPYTYPAIHCTVY